MNAVSPAFGAAPAAAPPAAGADLLALCARYVAMVQAGRAASAALTEEQRRADAGQRVGMMMSGDMGEDGRLAQRIAALPAATPEEMRAKARALRWFYGGSDSHDPFGWRQADALLGSLVDDACRLPAGRPDAGPPAPAERPHPGAAAGQAAGLDAELIQACADFNKLERRYLKLANRGAKDLALEAETDAALAAVAAEQQPFLDRICELRPRTHAGCAAIARSLALWDRELLKGAGPGNDTNERLLAALVAGLIWKRPEPASPDAALLALCATFHGFDAAAHDDANLKWEEDSRAGWDAFRQIAKATPRTEDGRRAKARVVLAKLEECHGDGAYGDPAAEAAAALLRDWAGVAPVPPARPSPILEAGRQIAALDAQHDAGDVPNADHEVQDGLNRQIEALGQSILDTAPATLAEAAVVLMVAAGDIGCALHMDSPVSSADVALRSLRRAVRFLAEQAAVPLPSVGATFYMPRHLDGVRP